MVIVSAKLKIQKLQNMLLLLLHRFQGELMFVKHALARFMLSDLLRTRLWKIQEHPLHMLDMVDRLSGNEVSLLDC